MKTYIFTEDQIQGVVNSLIYEHILKEQNDNLNLLKLNDIAEIVARLGMDQKVLLKIFIDMYRKEGSEGVIRLFNSATDLELEDFGYGRFHIKH